MESGKVKTQKKKNIFLVTICFCNLGFLFSHSIKSSETCLKLLFSPDSISQLTLPRERQLKEMISKPFSWLWCKSVFFGGVLFLKKKKKSFTPLFLKRGSKTLFAVDRQKLLNFHSKFPSWCKYLSILKKPGSSRLHWYQRILCDSPCLLVSAVPFWGEKKEQLLPKKQGNG